jgi:hypothetical protein
VMPVDRSFFGVFELHWCRRRLHCPHHLCTLPR